MTDNTVTKINNLRLCLEDSDSTEPNSCPNSLRSHATVDDGKLKSIHNEIDFMHLVKSYGKAVNDYNSGEVRTTDRLIEIISNITTEVNDVCKDLSFKAEVVSVKDGVVTVHIRHNPVIRLFNISMVIPKYYRIIMRTRLNNKKRWRKYYV